MRNILRLWSEAIRNGESVKVSSGETYTLKPSSDDTGSLAIGDGTTDWDVKVYLGSTSNYVLGDVGNNLFQLEGVDLLLGDNDELRFGDATSGDRVMTWNGSYLECGSPNGLWADAPSPADPAYESIAKYVVEQFNGYLDTTNVWTETVVGAGTQALVAGGGLLLTCQAGTDNACEQVEYAPIEPFLPAAGKTIWYEAKITITGDAQSEHAFGLFKSEDLTAVPDVEPADGILFTTQDGSLDLNLHAVKNGTATDSAAEVTTLVSGTAVTIGFLVDGVTSVTPYVNGVAGTAIAGTNLPNDEELTPFFLVRNGDGVTQQKMKIDYVKVVQLR